MNLFSNDKTVVGLFGDGKIMEQAINRLNEQGFGKDADSLQVIDELHYDQEAPVMSTYPSPVPGQAHTATMPVGTDALHPETDHNPTAYRKRTYDMLTDLGLGDEDATFYSEQVARGGSLIVLKTEEERASEARSIMEQRQAKTVVA